MNKKILGISIVLIFMFFGATFAQENDLPEAGMLPDSPFYFLKNWSENVGTFFTFGNENKAERFLELSEKRLAEVKALVEKENTKRTGKVFEKYQENLDKALSRAKRAEEKGSDIDKFLGRVSEATLRHQDVLAGVYEKVPEVAKEAIERAMNQAMKGHEKVIEAIPEEKREQIRENVRNKKQEIEQKLKEDIPVPEMEEVEKMLNSEKEIENIPDLPENQAPKTPGGLEKQESSGSEQAPQGPTL